MTEMLTAMPQAPVGAPPFLREMPAPAAAWAPLPPPEPNAVAVVVGDVGTEAVGHVESLEERATSDDQIVPIPPEEAGSAPALLASSSDAEPATATDRVLVDAEVFAKAVAAAVAAALDARSEALPARPAPVQWTQAMPVGSRPKRPFWSGLWHADVLLAVLAMVIVLVILLAWAS